MSGEILTNLLFLLLLSPTCLSLTIAVPKMWISEVYASNNSQDFIEIYDGGRGNVSLTNFSLKISNGSISEDFALDGLKTNSGGFLVVSSEDTDNSSKKMMKSLKEFSKDNLTLTLSNNISGVIQNFTKRDFQVNVVTCYEEVSLILLASNLSTKGANNSCPPTPVHIEQVTLLDNSTLNVTLHSSGLPKWKLKPLELKILINGSSVFNKSLDKFTTNVNETYSLNIPVEATKEKTIAVLLNFISNTSARILIDGVAFGSSNVSVKSLPKMWTYPDLYLPSNQNIQYVDLGSNNASMVKFCHCNLFSKFYAASALTNCSLLCLESIFLPPTHLPLPSGSPIDKPNNITPSSSSASSSSDSSTSASTSDVSSTNSSETSTQAESTATSLGYTVSTSHTTATVASNDLSTVSISAPSVETSTLNTTTTSNATTGISNNITSTMETAMTSSSPSTVIPTVPKSADNNSMDNSTQETPTSFSSSSSSPSSSSTNPDTLRINEILLGHHSLLDNWIELKGATPNSSIQYKLVWSDANGKNPLSFEFKTSKTSSNGLMYINTTMLESRNFLKGLSNVSGTVNLYDDGLIDCVTYTISDVPVNTEDMESSCQLHTPVVMTHREKSAAWTVNLCESELKISVPTGNRPNKCPIMDRFVPLNMAVKNVQKTKDFESLFIDELINKMSQKKEYMISKDFIRNITTKFTDEMALVTVSLVGYSKSHLQKLYAGYKSLFTPNSAVFKIGNDLVTVYRQSTLPPAYKENSSSVKVTVAVLLSLLAVFVLIVTIVCFYMKYKKKNLTHLFSKLYYRSDQDDLLVNMEDVGSQGSHFNNPYYNQLSV